MRLLLVIGYLLFVACYLVVNETGSGGAAATLLTVRGSRVAANRAGENN